VPILLKKPLFISLIIGSDLTLGSTMSSSNSILHSFSSIILSIISCLSFTSISDSQVSWTFLIFSSSIFLASASALRTFSASILRHDKILSDTILLALASGSFKFLNVALIAFRD